MSRLVLIVEDSETCAETLQIALESLPGMQTLLIRCPADALAAMRESTNEIVAVVTDLHLPRSDGFDLIRQLRAEPRYATLPIVLISGDSDPRLPAEALVRGADAFFSKPYSPSAVRRKLEQLLC
ncbi:MAG: response regulator [Terriglobia bacterium]